MKNMLASDTVLKEMSVKSPNREIEETAEMNQDVVKFMGTFGNLDYQGTGEAQIET